MSEGGPDGTRAKLTAAPSLDELLVDYEASLRKIAALPELTMRRAALQEALERPDDEVVWWIDQLLRGALWGHTAQMDALVALADWLIALDPDEHYDRLQALYQAAADGGRESVLMMLRNPPPHAALAAGAALPEVRLPIQRDVTIGERRTLARGRDRKLLERLLYDPNELVLTNLLNNPALLVADVVVVASRRPTDANLLRVVCENVRWFKELRVREALVHNPYAATGVSLKLLPTLPIQALRRIRYASDLHPLVHDFAKLLVQLREERTAPWRV